MCTVTLHNQGIEHVMTKRHIFRITLLATVFATPAMAGGLNFTAGDLVISTVSCSVGATACTSVSGGLDTASAITLQQFQLRARPARSARGRFAGAAAGGQRREQPDLGRVWVGVRGHPGNLGERRVIGMSWVAA